MQNVHDHIVTVPSDTSAPRAYAAPMVRRTAFTTAALVAATLVAGAGCTAAPAWQPVVVPADFQPASLAATDTGLLVGGRRNGAPLLVRVSGSATTGTVDLAPKEPYAEVADLISVAADGDTVTAIGREFGGAHSNPRLTLWDGSLRANLITSRPQEFFTFGGHDAGPLLGIETVGGTPAIFGSRTITAGSEGVIWTRSGATWTKHTGVDPALVSNPDRVLGFGALTRLGDRLVVAGDEIGLAGGIGQRPSLWVGGPTGGWRQVLLPVPSDLPMAAGQLSRATGVDCPAGANACWVAGWVRGQPVVWPVTIATDGTPVARPAARLRGAAPTDGADPVALVTSVAGRPVVSTGAAPPGLQLGCPDGWRALDTPDGPVTALVGSGSGLYLIAGGRLERLEPRPC
jgi:hypothetical protein